MVTELKNFKLKASNQITSLNKEIEKNTSIQKEQNEQHQLLKDKYLQSEFQHKNEIDKLNETINNKEKQIQSISSQMELLTINNKNDKNDLTLKIQQLNSELFKNKQDYETKINEMQNEINSIEKARQSLISKLAAQAASF